MFLTPNGDDLLRAFFIALDQRDLKQCAAIEAQVRALAATIPEAADWADYLAAILANERDHDWAEAERIFRTLGLSASAGLRLKGRAWLGLGRACEYQGKWQEAILAYQQCQTIFSDLAQPIDLVKTWKQLAIAHNDGFTKGDFTNSALETALDYCQRALGMLDRLPDSSNEITWLRGSIWNTMGLIHRNLGEWQQAIECYESDLRICSTLPAQDYQHGVAASLLNLGEIYQRQGSYPWIKARRAYTKALRLFRAADDAYYEAETLTNLGYLYAEQGQSAQALRYYRRAIHILEQLRAGVSAEDARANFFTTVADTYANVVLLCWQAGQAKEAFDYVERSRSRALLDLLAASSPSLDPKRLDRKREGRALSLTHVQARLPEDALLLEYFTTGMAEVYDGKSANKTPPRHRFPQGHVLIFAVTRADGVAIYDTGITPDTLRPAQLHNVAERHFLRPAIRRRLYDHLIAPIEALLRGKRTAYLIPHGPLHYIPFQALIAPDGEVLLREDGPAFVYAPSASILLRRKPRQRAANSAPCLALGYNGGDTVLRFAEDEARSIARLTGGEALTGPQPKKAVIYSQASRYRLLHIACHGIFDPNIPLNSALQLAADESLTALDVIEHVRLQCKLVILSACESGLSRVRRGDELIGLVRAFLFAGASLLLCTLWRVDDRSTRILMERFYQEILQGTPFAEALKRAQLYLMRLTPRQIHELDRSLTPAPVPDEMPEAAAGESPSFADPFYWAPFILVGYASDAA